MDEPQKTARQETCPKCGSNHMFNNHFLQHQKHDRVFIECAQCGHLVAKYILRNYIDPGFHYEQFLKLAKIHQEFSSGRKTLDNFLDLQEKAKTQFIEVKKILQEETRPDSTTLQDLLSEFHILEDSYQAFDE